MAETGEDILVHVNGKVLSILLVTNARAKRVSLRADPARGRVILIKPKQVSKVAAIEFAKDKAAWVLERLGEFLP